MTAVSKRMKTLLFGSILQPIQYRYALSLLILLSAAHVSADIPEISLVLKPKVCVLSSDEETCYDQIQVSWKSQESLSLCLYQKALETPLACWENANFGSHKMVLNTDASLAFSLREKNVDRLLASETFEVVHDHKEYRRARRNAWAFF